jgi:hypothetical protein
VKVLTSLVVGIYKLIKINESREGKPSRYIYMSPGMFEAWTRSASNVWAYDEDYKKLSATLKRNIIVTHAADAYGTVVGSEPLKLKENE